MKHFLMILVPLLFSVQAGFAETSTLSLDSVLELGLRNNLDIRQAQKDVQVAEYQLYESYADLFMPSISATGNFSYQDPQSVANSLSQLKLPSGQTIVITNMFPDNYSGGLVISKPLFQGFRYWNSKEMQKMNLDLAKMKYDDTVKNVRYSIQTNYYQLLLQKENVRLFETADINLKLRFDFMENLYRKNQTNELDYLKTKYNYKSNMPLLMNARISYSNTRQNLCMIIGITNSENMEFLGSYESLSNISLDNVDEAAMLLKVLSNDINIKTTQISIATTKLTQSINESARYPSLNSSFNYNENYRRDYSVINGRTWQPSWQIGLNLSIPIDGWIPTSRTAFTVGENQKSLEKLQFTETQQVLNLGLQFKTQLQQLTQLKVTADSLLDNAFIAKRSYELEKEQYIRGLVVMMDMNDYDLTHRQAELSYWQAVFNYAAAVLKVKTMMGE